MNRDTRTLIVVLVAVVTAGLASLGVYKAIQRMPVREVEVAHTYVVAASHSLSTGARLSTADLRLVPWPERSVVPGSFDKIESVVDRGVLVNVQENEPLTDAKLAPVAAGAGLSPTIPAGMRAISVQVNEVVGVAGFVTPGTRVDVFVTIRGTGTDSFTRVVVSNVQVLTAGTRYEQDRTKAGEAIPSSVVTLLLSPEDAERLVLASADGQIMLALRNPLDQQTTTTGGTRTASLFGDKGFVPAPIAPAPVAKPKRVVETPPPPPPAPAPAPRYTVETIRAAKRAEETVLHTEPKEPNQ